jgi:hypothetical protein
MDHLSPLNRRCFLGSSVATLAAGAALNAAEENSANPPASTEPTQAAETQTVAPPTTVDPQNGMPYGMIGNVKLSRLMLGGNLVSGYMHNRDLVYVPQLFRAYVTEEKIFETFKLCEENGINTVFESGGPLVARFNKERGGHLQVIPSVKPEMDQKEDVIKRLVQELVDTGCPALYIWGVAADRCIQNGRIDTIIKTVEIAKKHGIPVGVGSHSLLVVKECEKAQVPCDFYVKTFHADNYASAMPKELRKEFVWLDGGPGYYDNMWCINPEETAEFMKTVRKPWIAFKILAAGAIPPRDAFSHAFRNGADFVAVGMFDFQVKEDCELIKRTIKHGQGRQRPWLA